MNFTPELARKVLAGEKTVTRRLASENPRSPWWKQKCGLQVGGDYAVCPGRGKVQIGRVRVVGVALGPLGMLTLRETQLEGFGSQTAFYEAWAAINGGYDPRALVWRVEMRAL